MRTSIAFITTLAFLAGCASSPQQTSGASSPQSTSAQGDSYGRTGVLGLARTNTNERAALCHDYGQYLRC
jgi:hypothetical protein